MNHLAHARLAGPEPLDIAANLMGDFVRGRIGDRFPPRVAAGILLHRRIDSFTDDHPLHRRSRERLVTPFRRFAPILIDVYYDHFLARHFERFHDLPVERFTPHVYDALAQHRELLPRTLGRLAPIWRRRDLLAGYAELDVIDDVFKGISGRLSRANPVDRGGEPLRQHYEALEADFLAFFPELLAFAQAERERLTSPAR